MYDLQKPIKFLKEIFQNFLPKSKFFTIFCNKLHIKINHMRMLLLVLNRYYHVINIRCRIQNSKLFITPARITWLELNSGQNRNESKFLVNPKEIFTPNRNNIYGSLTIYLPYMRLNDWCYSGRSYHVYVSLNTSLRVICLYNYMKSINYSYIIM